MGWSNKNNLNALVLYEKHHLDIDITLVEFFNCHLVQIITITFGITSPLLVYSCQWNKQWTRFLATAGDFAGAIFNVGIFMSPAQEMKDGRGKCIFYGSLPQEMGGLTPMDKKDYGATFSILWSSKTSIK